MQTLPGLDLSGGAAFTSLAAAPFVIAAGLALLAFGRRIYWLLVAVAGFVLGHSLAQRLLEPETGTVALVVGVLAGLLCAALAVLFHRIALAGVGFVAGGVALLLVAGALRWDAGYWVLIAALAAGVGGALLARSLFDLALVVLTSIVGAALCVPAIGIGPPLDIPLFVGLAALGIAVQWLLARRAKGKG